jgi:hypothetical protein
MGYIGQDPRLKPIEMFEITGSKAQDLVPTDRFWPIEDPYFELADNGQDIMFKVSNYFKPQYMVDNLSSDEVEDLVVY